MDLVNSQILMSGSRSCRVVSVTLK